MKLLRSTATVSLMTLVSRVSGFVRDMVQAQVFGAGSAMDAFLVAFRIPNFMRRLFAEGSFSLAFVPVFAEAKEKGDAAALRELTDRVTGALLSVLLVVTALGVLAAPLVVAVFAPGFRADPEKFALTGELLRVTFPYLLFISLTALAGGILNSFNRFAIPALTPVLLNLSMIVAALGLAPYFERPVEALACGVFAAGVLQFAIQLPALQRLGLLPRPRWGFADPAVRRIMRLMLPTLFGSSVAQINLLFDTFVASFLLTGSVTWLYYTDRLLEFPLGMFGVALGTVLLPNLSRRFGATDGEGFSRTLDWGLRAALLIGLPATVGLILLAEPMLAALFQYGRFSALDTSMASLSLVALSAGLPAFMVVKVLAPAFYARQDTRTPVRSAVASLLANMLFSVLLLIALLAWQSPRSGAELIDASVLVQELADLPGGHACLALASALAGYVNAIGLWKHLRRQGVYQRLAGWRAFFVTLILATALLAAILLLGRWIWPELGKFGALGRVLRLFAMIGSAALAYFLVLYLRGVRLSQWRGT